MTEIGCRALLRTVLAGTFCLAALTPAFAIPIVSAFTPSQASPQPVLSSLDERMVSVPCILTTSAF